MGNTYILELDGKLAARLLSLDSTGIHTQVLSSTRPLGVPSSKILTGAPGEIKFKFGADASRWFLDWLSGRGISKKSGAINVLDARSVVIYRIEFLDAMVTSFFMPGLDRSAKSAATFSASFRPERLVHSAGRSKLTAGSSTLPAPKQWNASNFRFKVGGLPIDDNAVTKVSAFGLNTFTKAFFTGNDRFPTMEPSKTSYSNIVIAVPMSKASALLSWGEETVRPFPSEKNASLEYLGPGDKIIYYTAEFKGLGVISTTVSRSGGESSKDVIAELYYDSVKLSYI